MAWISPIELISDPLIKGEDAKERTTAASKMSIVVECLPKVVDGFVAGFSTSVDKNAYFGLFRQGMLVISLRDELLTSNIFPMALNNQRCELIFF